jgi:DNA-binding GntR family transcriptional regulator
MGNNKIYKIIKERIVFLKYKPKQILSIKELAEEFRVSSIPIREALVLLENEKLIHIIPYKGIYVTEVSLQELKNAFEMRLFLIEYIAKLAIQRITSEEKAKMRALLNRIKKEKNRNELIHLDAEFHDLLNASTKNQLLVEILQKIRIQFTRLWYFSKEKDFYSKHTVKDIEKIIIAIEESDENKCKEILKDHTIRFIDRIKESLFSRSNFK